MVVNGLLSQELLKCLGCLIVKALEAWLEALTCQEFNASFVARENVGTCSRAQWFGVDIVAVIVIDH